LTETNYLAARGRRMVAGAETEELMLAVLKGRLHRSEDVEYCTATRDSAIRARLLAISSRITRLLVGKVDPVEIRGIIDAEVLAVLDELRAYDPREFNEQNEAYLARYFSPGDATKEPNGHGNGNSQGERDLASS
jgi:hypothetical protein